MKVCGACDYWVPQSVDTCPKCGKPTAEAWAQPQPVEAPIERAIGADPAASGPPPTAVAVAYPSRDPGAWGAGAPYEPAPVKTRRSVAPLVASLVFFAVLAGSGFVVYSVTRGTSYPSHWDAQVEPIANRVQSMRGLTFKHPVKVNYLSDADFEEQVTSGPAELDKQSAAIEHQTALMRALGWIGGDVDLAAAVDTTRAADVIAFYDPETEQIYIRGASTLTIDTKVTLAHELTHVLQDQHFDLEKRLDEAAESTTGSADASRALIEGDADRIEKQYLKSQSAVDRRRYDEVTSDSGDEAVERTKDVPMIVRTFFGAPYIFGPDVIDVLEEMNGTAAIDTALAGPAPSTRIYLDPIGIADLPPVAPDAPELERGELRVPDLVDFNRLDDLTLYLMLAARLEPGVALRAADAFSAASTVAYTRGGHTCFRAAVDARSPSAKPFMLATLRRWADAMPDARVDNGVNIIVESCDPGPKAAAPAEARIREAVSLAKGRDVLTATFVSQGLSRALARCGARVFAAQPATYDALLHGDRDVSADARAQIAQEGRAAGLDCRRDNNAGLP